MTSSVLVSETTNQVPAFEVRVFAEIDGVADWRFESPPFNLSPGELDRRIPFEVPRPKYGTLVHSCNNHQTLYGRDFNVTVLSEEGALAIDKWHEDEYDPETDGGRYEVMQRGRKAARAPAVQTPVPPPDRKPSD